MKASGQHDAVLRMARAGIGFGAGELFLAQVDLRLIPELDPFVVERLVEVDARGDRRRHAELELVHDLDDGVGLERLLEHRQHVELVLTPMLLTCSSTAAPRLLINCTAPRKPRLPSASIDLDRVGGFERDIVEHEIGQALLDRLAQAAPSAKFHGVDAGAVQHQRQEMPDAGLLVDHVAERGAPRAPAAAPRRQRRPSAVGRLAADGCHCLGHGIPMQSDRAVFVAPSIGVPNLLKLGFPRPRLRCHERAAKSTESIEEFGDPGWIRTSDPQLRRLVLYPAELRGLARLGFTRAARRLKGARGDYAANLAARGTAMTAIADLTCAELTQRLPRGALVAGRGGARLPRRIERHADAQRLYRRRREGALEAAAASEARWRAGAPLGADRRRSGHDQGQYLAQGPARPARLEDRATRAPARRRRAGGGALARSRAPSSSARPVCPSMAGSASATARSPASPAIRGTSTTRPAARPAAARWRRCSASACCISAPTAPARCGFRRPSPAFSA